MRDHGGNIDEAIAMFGGEPDQWIDLSTGINRVPYPIPHLAHNAWTALPTRTARKALCEAATHAYKTTARVLPVSGAQAAIQLIPRLSEPGHARVLTPTYNEHSAALRFAGWDVEEVGGLADLAQADLAVVVNPNNPDGRRYEPQDILAVADKIGHLIVDESFADASSELSLAPHCGQAGLLVLRSFGKFYGLAGLRLGFVIGHPEDLASIAAMAGPWSVSGPALEIGRVALSDDNWCSATISRLTRDAQRLDDMTADIGWKLIGGTELFRTYETLDAPASQVGLAQHKIWSRIFPYSKTWVRLGLPGSEREWSKLKIALRDAAVS